MQKIYLIWNLLLRANSPMLKVVFWILPFVLVISFSVSLFLHHLLGSYENYLIQSYLGNEGRLQIQSSESFIKDLQKLSKKRKWDFSLRTQINTVIIFKNSHHKVRKNIEIILLEDEYFIKKFGIKKDVLLVNSVLEKSFGRYEVSHYKQLNFPSLKRELLVESIQVIPSGFLKKKMRLYMARSHLGVLLNKKRVLYTLEYGVEDLSELESIKSEIKDLAVSKQELSVKIIDAVTQNKELSQIIYRFKVIQTSLSAVIGLMLFTIVLIGINILYHFKSKSLRLLQDIGLEKKIISKALIIALSGVFFMSLIVSIFFQEGLVKIFIEFTQHKKEFFISISFLDISMLTLVSIFLLALLYISSNFSLGRH